MKKPSLFAIVVGLFLGIAITDVFLLGRLYLKDLERIRAPYASATSQYDKYFIDCGNGIFHLEMMDLFNEGVIPRDDSVNQTLEVAKIIGAWDADHPEFRICGACSYKQVLMVFTADH